MCDCYLVFFIFCHKSSHFRYHPPNKSAGILREFEGILQDELFLNNLLQIVERGSPTLRSGARQGRGVRRTS